MKLIIKPISFKTACNFVNENHRHHKSPQGCKFSIGCFVGDRMVGVAICGRPVGRFLDDGLTCEITRVCTDGTQNACSKLYGACCRIAKEMGYRKVITYILESEDGASVKASNFVCEGKAGGTHWTGVRNKGQEIPNEMKQRYVYNLEVEK